MHWRVKLEVEVEGELLVVSLYCWDGLMLAEVESVVPELAALSLEGVPAGSLMHELGQTQQHEQLRWAAAADVAVVAEEHRGNIFASLACHGNVAGGGVGAEGAAWAERDQSPHRPCANKQSVLLGIEAAHLA